MAEFVEFVECGSLSISYDATGKATISCSVIKSDDNNLSKSYEDWRLGGVTFYGNVMNLAQSPIFGSGGWCRWQLQWEGIGN